MPKNQINNILGQVLDFASNNQTMDKKIGHDKQMKLMNALMQVELDKNTKKTQATRDSSILANQQWITEQNNAMKMENKRLQNENNQMMINHTETMAKIAEAGQIKDREIANQHQLDLTRLKTEMEENWLVKKSVWENSLAKQVARMPNEEYRFSELGMSSALGLAGEETGGLFHGGLDDSDMTDYINAGRGYVETEMGELGKRDVKDAQVQKAIKALAKLYKKGNVHGYVKDRDFYDDQPERDVLGQVIELMKDLGMKEDDIYKQYGRPIWMDAK